MWDLLTIWYRHQLLAILTGMKITLIWLLSYQVLALAGYCSWSLNDVACVPIIYQGRVVASRSIGSRQYTLPPPRSIEASWQICIHRFIKAEGELHGGSIILAHVAALKGTSRTRGVPLHRSECLSRGEPSRIFSIPVFWLHTIKLSNFQCFEYQTDVISGKFQPDFPSSDTQNLVLYFYWPEITRFEANFFLDFLHKTGHKTLKLAFRGLKLNNFLSSDC